jgi:hypothetical protein
MNEDSSEGLITKATKAYGPRRCKHARSTLVQHEHIEFGWFACYQCDECGQITRREVTADDLDIANNAPVLDVAMYLQVTTERLSSRTLTNTMGFFAKAAK